MPEPTIDLIVKLITFAWLIGNTLSMYLRKPGEDATRDVTDLAKRTIEQDQRNALIAADLRSRCDLLDERVRNLPTHTEIRSLISGLAEVKGQLTSVSDGVARQQRTLELIQDYLNTKR